MTIHLIYLHGFDNSSQSVKARIIREYCAEHHSNIQVHNPDLNMPPAEVIDHISTLVQSLKIQSLRAESLKAKSLKQPLMQSSQNSCDKVCILGSSLGGFYATLLGNLLAVPVFLLNPCLYPEETLIGIFGDALANTDVTDDTVFHVTGGGWHVTYGDMRWSTENLPTSIKYPEKVALLLTTGDEVIDYTIANNFYRKHRVTDSNIHIQQGNDHQISGFIEHLPLLMHWVHNMSS